MKSQIAEMFVVVGADVSEPHAPSVTIGNEIDADRLMEKIAQILDDMERERDSP